MQHMQALRKSGTTVVFVSHNMHLVRNTCERVLLLLNGQISAEGEPSDVIAEYEQLLLTAVPAGAEQAKHTLPSFGSEGTLTLASAEMVPVAQPGGRRLASHLPARLNIHYKAAGSQKIGRVDIRIVRDDGTLCCTADSSQFAQASRELSELSGEGALEVTYDPLQLASADYVAIVQITDPSDSLVIASVQSEPFHVHARGAGPARGVYVPHLAWARRPPLED
jgi:hypothetical protein